MSADNAIAHHPFACDFAVIFSVLLPVYLQAAGGDPAAAHAALTDLINAHGAANAAEVELVSRIHTLSHLARDSMTRSLNPDLADALVLRYRSSANTMLRTADQCRKALDTMQTRRREAEAEQAVHAYHHRIDTFCDAATAKRPRAEAGPDGSVPPQQADYPDYLDMTNEQIVAMVTETRDIIARGRALFGDPYAHHATAADADLTDEGVPETVWPE
jgi:hypothetical protein